MNASVNYLVDIKDLYEGITKTISDWRFCEFWSFCYSMKMKARACSEVSFWGLKNVTNQTNCLMFSFSEKATNICPTLLMIWRLLSICQNHREDCANFCGLLRKAELYITYFGFITLNHRNAMLYWRSINVKFGCSDLTFCQSHSKVD